MKNSGIKLYFPMETVNMQILFKSLVHLKLKVIQTCEQ